MQHISEIIKETEAYQYWKERNAVLQKNMTAYSVPGIKESVPMTEKQPEVWDYLIEKREGIQVQTEWLPGYTRAQVEHLLKVRGGGWVIIATIKPKQI